MTVATNWQTSNKKLIPLKSTLNHPDNNRFYEIPEGRGDKWNLLQKFHSMALGHDIKFMPSSGIQRMGIKFNLDFESRNPIMLWKGASEYFEYSIRKCYFVAYLGCLIVYYPLVYTTEKYYFLP